MNLPKSQFYPIEQKLAAVQEYLTSNLSLLKICEKYKIKGTKQIRNCISLYNKGNLLKSGGLDSMKVKGIRKNLTLEDRAEVVKDYLEISKDYSETAIKFQVSYQQVYLWVKKYNKFGINGLIDRRGKRKSEDELTEVEKLQLENKLLKAKNRRIELEVAFKKIKRVGMSVMLNPFKHHAIYLAIKEIKDKYKASIRELCEIAGIARSSYYKWLEKYKNGVIQTFNHELIE